MNPAPPTPTVLIVGGPDVDARIELMSRLRPEFNCIAAGSAPDLAQRFETAGFAYHAARQREAARVRPVAMADVERQMAEGEQRYEALVAALERRRPGGKE